MFYLLLVGALVAWLNHDPFNVYVLVEVAT